MEANCQSAETEIDRLNDVGALINPYKIGSWIDMSAKGGMDGGWYFPVDISTKLALDAADPGDAVRKVWSGATNMAWTRPQCRARHGRRRLAEPSSA